jgi:hypothetical protein
MSASPTTLRARLAAKAADANTHKRVVALQVYPTGDFTYEVISACADTMRAELSQEILVTRLWAFVLIHVFPAGVGAKGTSWTPAPVITHEQVLRLIDAALAKLPDDRCVAVEIGKTTDRLPFEDGTDLTLWYDPTETLGIHISQQIVDDEVILLCARQ